MRLSIAMTTYNGARYLEDQLQSFISQTRRPDELIICDDRSTDQTAEIVERFADRAPFPVQFTINPEKLGIGRNFEKAIGLASGQVIFLSDQDDVWHPDKLDRFEKLFDEAPEAGLVFADANVVDEQLNPLGYTFWERLDFGRHQQAYFAEDRGFEILIRHCFVAGATLAFRSELRELILPIPPEWLYDAWIALVASAVGSARIIPAPLNDYRQHQRQAMGGQRKSLWTKYREAKEKVDAEYYRRMARQHDLLCQRVAAKAPMPVLELIDAKTALCRSRARMRENWLLRWPLAFRELITGRYHRYAHGYRTMLLDLFV